MFFVVSTGRSGSRTVAEVLAQSPSCECRHEPFPQLIAEAPRFLYGELAQGDLVRLLRETRSPTVDGKIYGESSNKLSLIIPALVEAFPGSQFLWLVRDGRDFVCSGLQRGWYEPGEETESAGDWQRWRLRGDRSGDIAPDAWRAMDRFERVCWLWSFTNRLIEQELVRHGPEHYRVVTIERLGSALPDLCDFLGLEPVSFVVGRANRRVVRGVADEAVAGSTNLVDAVQTWTDWTAEQREIFTRWCGPLMDRHYPGWRSDDGQWLAVPGEVDAAGHPISTSGLLALQGDGDDLGLVLRSLLADVAEIKQMRSQLRSLTRAHERHLKDSAAELGELRRSHGKTLSREEDAQRRLHEYEVRDLKAEHERQIRDVERKLAGAQAQLDDVVRQLEWEKKERRALKASESYRLGHAVVRLAKSPVLALQSMQRRLLRRGPGKRQGASGSSRSPGGVVEARSGDDGSGGVRGGTLPLRDADRNDGPVLPIPMGSAVKENAPRAPVTALVMLLGMTDPEIERCVEQVASLQVMLAGFCPLFVTDSDAFQFFRRYEYLFEYLPPADAYIAQHGAEEWTEFVNERLRSIIATYQPQRIIVLGGSSSSHAIERGLLDPFLQAPEID